MANISLISILKRELIGKQLKFCTSHQQLVREFTVWKKKSVNVTDIQFLSDIKTPNGNFKYKIGVTRTKEIGWHTKYDTQTITDIEIAGDYYEEGECLRLILDNGKDDRLMEVGGELEHLHGNIYQIKER